MRICIYVWVYEHDTRVILIHTNFEMVEYLLQLAV